MTADEFNEKYKDYIEKGFDGLEFDIPEVTEMLDKEFQTFIQKPGFPYCQIKLKFGMARFYANGIPFKEKDRIEDQINNLLYPKREVGIDG